MVRKFSSKRFLIVFEKFAQNIGMDLILVWVIGYLGHRINEGQISG